MIFNLDFPLVWWENDTWPSISSERKDYTFVKKKKKQDAMKRGNEWAMGERETELLKKKFKRANILVQKSTWK